jgi:CRISPR-associated protein Cmr5
MQTRDQKYAIDAYANVTTIKENKKEKTARKYGVMCHKLPILIHTAGLAQALVFVESRGAKDDIYKTFLVDLGKTIEEEKIAERARVVDLNDYMRLTAQVMAALVWYKRFAQSILDVDASATEEEV